MKRSFGVSLFSIWVLLLGIANLIRSLSFFRQSRFLANIGISLNPIVAAGESFFWAISFVACGFGLWKLKERARRFALILVPLYYFGALVKHILFVRSDFGKSQTPLLVIYFATIVAFSIWFLNRPLTKERFR
jgi:hypothetical protein